MESAQKVRAPRNRTLSLTEDEIRQYSARLLKLAAPARIEDIGNRTINQDFVDALAFMPRSWADLIFLDPPYNLTKSFGTMDFRERSLDEYERYLNSWLPLIVALLKPNGSLYICGDWRSSAAIHRTLQKHLRVRNRITWEREKGRGAFKNWKNCSEDIWFCTKSDAYTFNVDAVKLKRKVIAPYTEPDGSPKDWDRSENGNYRLTHPSNIWTDLTIPFWSMPENTDHPTQKPEKLVAKIILASSREGDLVFDPFLGSGTTSVVAKKLGRRYIGIESSEEYCCLAEKRLDLAQSDRTIQGYSDGVFWERNSLRDERTSTCSERSDLLPFAENVKQRT